MKLTKSDREAFVRAVLDDVPQVDYREQMQAGWPKDKTQGV